MNILLEILRFFFGAGWMMLWNISFLLAMGMFVIGPQAMLASDALRTPVPTASLGTFGYVMIIAVVLAVTTPVAVGMFLRAGGMTAGWSAIAAFGSGVAVCAATVLVLGAMAQHGGRMWVTAAWILIVGTIVGHLAMMYVATGRGTAAAA